MYEHLLVCLSEKNVCWGEGPKPWGHGRNLKFSEAGGRYGLWLMPASQIEREEVKKKGERSDKGFRFCSVL